MPTQRDMAFAETLSEVAIAIDRLCLRLAATQDSRADEIIGRLRFAEEDCDELAEQVSA